ncbi:hypothetical protein B0T20DRAFT_350026 [Sordaria brevicollis]|uniref:Uncharacterized protein n=1 Tax=Sordaria brevicollis TaxID=83679 RepID=A0AAE0PHY2_SORBR|nr:hypothetical protein B0T20DRAFT_350026 [Sordaria brevicollis]
MVETTAVAAIKRQDRSSLWSPRDVLQPNPLFEIIASYWGAETTSDVIHRILSSRSLPSNQRAIHHPLSSQVVCVRGTSGATSGAHIILPDPEATPIPRSQTPSRIPRQTQSALAVRAGTRPTSGLIKTRTMESSSDNTVKPPPAPTRAAPPIPRRQASLKIRAQTSRVSSAEENRGVLEQGTSQLHKKALPFLPGEDSDSEDDVMQTAAGLAADCSGRRADIHAHGSVNRKWHVQAADAVAIGHPPSNASMPFSEALRVEEHQSQAQQSEQKGLSDTEEGVTPNLAGSLHPKQANLNYTPFTQTPGSVESTGSIIKKNDDSGANTRCSSDISVHTESSPSFGRSTNSLRNRSRPTELPHSSHLVPSSVTAPSATSAQTRQNKGNSIAKPPSPPPPPRGPPIPGATPFTEEQQPFNTTSMSRTSSMTTRIASPVDFDAMEFGLNPSRHRAGNNNDLRDITSESYDSIVDLGFTTQTLPSRYNRSNGGMRPHNGSVSGPRGLLGGGIDRVHHIASSGNGSGSGSVNGRQNNNSRQGGRVAAATRYFNNGGAMNTGGGGSMSSRAGGGGVTMVGNNNNGTGSWRQRGLGNQIRGAGRECRQGHENEKQAGRWGWPSWW